MARSDYERIVRSFIRDAECRACRVQVDDALDMAIARLSSDYPAIKSARVTFAGGSAGVPPGWDSSSEVRSIEYPLGRTPPACRSDGFHHGNSLFLEGASGDAIVTYTAKHSLDFADTTTDEMREPVASYAASIMCGELAAAYSSLSEPLIEADSIDHGGKAQEYSQRAKELRSRYTEWIASQAERISMLGRCPSAQASTRTRRARVCRT